jgi:signal transduction histidine kinase
LKPGLKIVYLFIIVIPFGLITWLGIYVSQNENEMLKNQFNRVYLTQLNGYRTTIEALKSKYEQRLNNALILSSYETDQIRQFVRKDRLIEQMFILNPQNEIIHPKKNYLLTNQETDFLNRTAILWSKSDPFFRPKQEDLKNDPLFGWHTWFWNQETRFIFWKKVAGGLIVGVEINPSVILADMIAILPDTPHKSKNINNKLTGINFETSEPVFYEFRVVIENVKGDSLYQWGNYTPDNNESYQASLPLSVPFNMWQLKYYTSENVFAQYRNSSTFNLVIILSVLCLCLFGLGYYFYRENTRQLKVAGQKVTFVNQVSHELKTPLTNIRLYAELLENQSAKFSEKSRSYIGVVISESQRLSRLINNVLTFANPQKYQQKLRLLKLDPDEIIQNTINSFLPAFKSKSLEIIFEKNGNSEFNIDPDILEQIIGNLLSNIEKYASSGGKAVIKSEITADTFIITIADNGPGIPVSLQKKVFLPFYRISNLLSDGISGTGIGLTISRNLAQLHGGNLSIIPSSHGVSFKLELKTYP